jgi:deoxyribodipyrimidine photo-lyase
MKRVPTCDLIFNCGAFSLTFMPVDARRIRQINTALLSTHGQGFPIVYIMSRDQRVTDNWALLYALELAQKNDTYVHVVALLVPGGMGGGRRQFDFKIRGLEEVEKTLRGKNIPFEVLVGGDSFEVLQNWFDDRDITAAVYDFNPLRISDQCVQDLGRYLESSKVPLYQVDAHNIVPTWVASTKLEIGARTLRPKVHRLLGELLTPYPTVLVQKGPPAESFQAIDWEQLQKNISVDESVTVVDWIQPGEKAGKKALKNFIEDRLPGYGVQRNDPTLDHQSDLSPYIHFGQLSAQRIALEVIASRAPQSDKDAYLEELIVRRELADNFVLYNPDYDNLDGIPSWAKKSLDAHRSDTREYLYTLEQFEEAKTHEDLWNASERQLVEHGKLHGYLRMYWAKKILEWTASPEEALQIAQHLNDRYSLDGRDPNGFNGVMWSIGGVHDRPWFDRSVYGVVRYMNANGAKAKFRIQRYIDQWLP